MVGERIREARLDQNLSLTTVAAKVRVSPATLSRIENGKQTLDVGLFLALAKTLDVSPEDLLGASQSIRGDETLVAAIAALSPAKRIRLWRELAVARASRPAKMREFGQRVEELLAQIDFLKKEIETLRVQLRRRPVRRQ